MATVLPWRRSVPQTPEPLAALLEAYRERHPRAGTGMIREAYETAAEAHKDQVRRTGEPYVTHPLAVALILSNLGMDEVTLSAALLHDTVEDTKLSLDDLARDFGSDVAGIVDGVTKLERIKFASKEAQQAATIRKMLIAMANDGRVLVIKLADRLHNMRTLGALPRWKQERTARETLDIYAPLAHRLGIADMKWQLEDLSFAALHARRFAEIELMVTTRTPERDLYIEQVIDVVRTRLAAVKVHGEVVGRPKHFWSIYEKMVFKGRDFDDIFDLVGIRILVDHDSDCYTALGCIHGIWTPVQGRIKDYISMPKFNNYKSLHTTVIGPQGKPLEVQIRTREMHHWAEFGIAAHWAYKASKRGSGRDRHPSRGDMPAPGNAFMDRVAEIDIAAEDPNEFLASLKLDLEHEEVYVFTPRGDVQTLPSGATPVDFAYSIHTDVGHRCIGARVNGRLMPLDTELHSGDVVEVVASKAPTAGPSRDWIKVVVSPRARNKIKQWFSRERREDAIEQGRDDLAKAMRKLGLPVKLTNSAELIAVGESMNYPDLDTLFAAIGEGHVSAVTVAHRLEKDHKPEADEEQLPVIATAPRRRASEAVVGVHVEGLDDVMVRLSRCCTPVPGDRIIGFVTRGRGVSVHRADCSNAAALAADGNRLMDVEWDERGQGTFVTSVEVKALDRTRLLNDVTRVLSEHQLNILTSSTHTSRDRVCRMRFEFEMADPSHLEHLIAALKRVDSVYDAYRVLPSPPKPAGDSKHPRTTPIGPPAAGSSVKTAGSFSKQPAGSWAKPPKAGGSSANPAAGR